jgi:glyoxylase-like metal-dependent hydrolase (beta-lactamase superfamily II)
MDHAGGVGKILEEMPEAKVVVHERGAPHLVDPARLWEDSQRALGQMARDYGPITPVPEDRIIIAKDGMLIDLDGVELEVIETPGHAPHHLSFWDNKEGRLFAGEAAGVYNDVVGYVRPSAPPPFHIEHAINSLDKLISLNPKTLYYAHFGGVDQALNRLNSYKPRLVMWVKTVVDCLENGDGEPEIYAAIRENDDSVALIGKLPADQCDRETYFVDNTIAGFTAYIERFGSEYISQL